MKKLLIISSLMLSACANVQAANEESITISARGALAEKEAFKMASEHCSQYGKSAVPSNTVYRSSTVFRCE